MDLKALRYFISVYENGSLSAAAKQCFIAQPSISAAIQGLESELSGRLFERSVRGVKPTDAAEQLYPLAKQLLGQASAIKTLFNEKSEKLPVRLGLTKGLGVTRMSALLKEFTGSLDAMELTLVAPEELCDARIVGIEEVRTNETFIPMWQEDYALALSHQHILSFNDEITLDDLQHQAFIQRTPCYAWPLLLKQLEAQDVSIDIRAKIQTINYAIGLVNAGVGIAFLPLHPETEQQSDVIFKPIKSVNISRRIGLAYRQSTQITDLLRRIITRYQTI